MLFSIKETLEDLVVRMLLNGPQTIKTLHYQVLSHTKVSQRAVYKSVHQLLNAEVLLRGGNKIWLNEEWLRRIRENLSTPLPQFSKNERAEYRFTTIDHLDSFWKTIAFQLEGYERNTPVFFYNPHNFWAYVPNRKQSEDAYYAHFLTIQKPAYFTVGGTNSADFQFKKRYQHEFLHIHPRNLVGFNRRDHITVAGDHIVTVRLPLSVAKHIDTIYETNQLIEDILPAILEEYSLRGEVRLRIERNAIKAARLRSLLSRDFHVPSMA